jgi:ribonuclease HII
MPLLIATDEAGYGPQLGPLVIVATAWQLKPGIGLKSAHKRLARPIDIDGVGELRIDDSKRLFVRKRISQANTSPASTLDLINDAAAAWTATPLPSENFRDWLNRIAPNDLEGLSGQPWFASLAVPLPVVAPGCSAELPISSGQDIHQTLIRHWSGGGLQLVGIAARIIDAARFNRLLEVFTNKAELLSHMTCELALKLRRQHQNPVDAVTHVYSDRHGGRAYYGGLLQHHCPEHIMRVISESTQCSSYCLDEPDALAGASVGSIQWSFTVGGDSYPPVALSSIIAKSTRERLMGLFNQYFQAEAAEHLAFGTHPLRPTAGYSVDAARFLQDILPIRARRSLADAILIRSR